MSAVPTLDSVREQIDAMFPPASARKQHALDWGKTPDGRETIDATREHLKSVPKPVNPTGA